MADHVNEFLPPVNEVWGKVIFLHLFVILSRGGASSWGGASSQGVPPPGGCLLPGGASSWGGCFLWRCASSWGVCFLWRLLPPGGCFLLGGCLVETPWDGYCCGWYASYWNAFLYDISTVKYEPFPEISMCKFEEHIMNL